MRIGTRTSCQGVVIDYKCLRAINPQAARRAVLEYLRSCDHNVSRTALIFGINRSVVYDILRKELDGDLDDRSKVPHSQPRRTPKLIEDRIVEIKSKERSRVRSVWVPRDCPAISNNMRICLLLPAPLDTSCAGTNTASRGLSQR